jgi:hypothetical protein
MSTTGSIPSFNASLTPVKQAEDNTFLNKSEAVNFLNRAIFDGDDAPATLKSVNFKKTQFFQDILKPRLTDNKISLTNIKLLTSGAGKFLDSLDNGLDYRNKNNQSILDQRTSGNPSADFGDDIHSSGDKLKGGSGNPFKLDTKGVLV